MKKQMSERKTTNKKHNSIVQTKIQIAESTKESQELHEGVKDTSQNIHWWCTNVENQLRKFLNERSIPSDTLETYKTRSGEHVKLQELIREDYLDIAGAYEAGQALAYLFKSFDVFNDLKSFIENTNSCDEEKNNRTEQLNYLMLSFFKFANTIQLITKASLEDSALAGKSRTTEAHQARTKESKNKKTMAEKWYIECRKTGKDKTHCYRLCVKEFKKNNIEVAFDTIRGWFKSRKDLL